jgi:hypothetical protein
VFIAHIYNPSYSGGRDQRIVVPSQDGQIIHETLSQKYPKQAIKQKR